MKVSVYNDSASFLADCRPLLEKDEAFNNGMLSIMSLIDAGSDIFERPAWLATIEDDNEIIGCAVHARPDGLHVSEIPEAAVPVLFDAIDKDVGMPHRIMASQANSESLSRMWREKAGANVTLSTRWHVYRLDELVPPKRRTDGVLRKGRAKERELVAEWGRHYGDEKPAPVDVSDFMVRKLNDGDLFVWDDDGAKTILTLSGKMGKCVRISAVYTPPEFRGRGYASTATADLSQLQFDSGFGALTLTAMIDDPAERIYIRLGYEEIGTRICYLLSE